MRALSLTPILSLSPSIRRAVFLPRRGGKDAEQASGGGGTEQQRARSTDSRGATVSKETYYSVKRDLL